MKLKRLPVNKAKADLIPMIDVVFQLILFFLVSTTFIQLPGIKLNLPLSSTSEAVKTAGITLTVQKNGAMWLDDTAVNAAQLSAKLVDIAESEKKAGRSVSDFPVRFEADSLVTNGTIVRIFDILRQNGFLSVNLRTIDDKR